MATPLGFADRIACATTLRAAFALRGGTQAVPPVGPTATVRPRFRPHLSGGVEAGAVAYAPMALTTTSD